MCMVNIIFRYNMKKLDKLLYSLQKSILIISNFFH